MSARVEPSVPSSARTSMVAILPGFTIATANEWNAMHILLTVNLAWNIVNFRGPLVRALIADGHRLTALVPVDDTVPRLRDMGCKIVPLDMDAKGLSPRADLRLLRDMRAAFRRLQPDAVLSFTIKNNIYGAIASRGLPLTFIPNVTGLGTAFLGSALLSRISKFMYRRAFGPLRHVVFQNDDDRALFESLHLTRAEQAVMVPGSGIDLDRFAVAPSQRSLGKAPTFLMIGRVLADKGVREYAEAARLLKTRYPEAKFQLLGALDAVNRTALSAEEVESWIAEGIVEYLGKADDVRPAIGAADCIVLPSYREGTPRVLLEGAAMGRPMVTTDVAGCRAVVQPGRTGFLCAPRSAADLAQAIEKMIRLSPEELAAMGKAARADMEDRFSVERVIEIYRALLSTLPSAASGATA